MSERQIGFNSIEELIQAEREAEHTASSNVLPTQSRITWGDYVIRVHDHPANPDGGLCIYGKLDTAKEFVDGEIEAGASEEEAEQTFAQMRDLVARGFRSGQWYSEVCPEGEHGDAHVVTMWPIHQEEFEEARARGWEDDGEVLARCFSEMAGEMRDREDLELASRLFDTSLEVTDTVLGKGTYAKINKDNPNPHVQAAIKRAEEKA